jgi:hypothetical protein
MMKLQVNGRVNEPQMFTAKNGRNGQNFSIANEYKEKKGDDIVLLTQWIDCTQWQNDEQPLAKIKKGDKLNVIGIPITEVYQVKETKEFKAKLKCIVSWVEVVNELPFE